MQVETIPLVELREDPENARRHPQRNLDAIRASLERWGQMKPIVIDAANVVIAGNGTLAAARSLGWPSLQCVRSGLDGVERRAYGLADNRTAELAEWDPGQLAASLRTLQAEDFGLDAAGFDAAEVDKLLGEIRAADDAGDGPGSAGDTPVPDTFEVVVECRSESHQRELFDRLRAEGLPCRVLTL